MSSFRTLTVATAAALIAAIGVAASPAHAAIIHNALTAGGSAIDDLNGVVVEAVRRDRIDGVEPDLGDKTGEIVIDRLSQVNPGEHR